MFCLHLDLWIFLATGSRDFTLGYWVSSVVAHPLRGMKHLGPLTTKGSE